jgi:diacylglycerol kinase
MGKPPELQSEKHEVAAFIAGFRYAFRGFWYTLRTQRNMRVHTVAALLVLLAGWLFRISPGEFALLILAIAGVMVTEMVNTVCEIMIDLVQPELHPQAGTAKDVAAGAVLLSAILAIVIGMLVLGPHLWSFLLLHI